MADLSDQYTVISIGGGNDVFHANASLTVSEEGRFNLKFLFEKSNSSQSGNPGGNPGGKSLVPYNPLNVISQLGVGGNVNSSGDEEEISIRYTRDYNILSLHERIIHKLTEQMRNVHNPEFDLVKKLAFLRKKIRCMQTRIERNNTLSEIGKLEEKIEKIKSGHYLRVYNEKAIPLIESYQKLGTIIETVSFDTIEAEKDDGDNEPLTEEDIRRLIIIENFISLAEGYLKIDAVRITSISSESCESCGADLTDIFIDETGTQKCLVCGMEKYIISLAGHYGMKASSSVREYDAENNFIKEMTYFQGKENVHIDEERLFLSLDSYFAAKGKESREIIKQKPLNEQGKREGTNLKALLDALKDTGYPQYYKHANKIGKEYWGWELYDLIPHHGQIMEHYRATQKVYYRIDRKRSSNIPSQLRLFRHLQLVGIKVKIEDFKLCSTPDSSDESEQLWMQMVEGAELPYLPLIDPGEDSEDSWEAMGKTDIERFQNMNIITMSKITDGEPEPGQ